MTQSKVKIRFFQIGITLLLICFLGCGNNQKKKKELTETKVESPTEPFFKISLAQWSLNNAVNNNGADPFDFAKDAKALGFEGVEYVSQLYQDKIDSLGLQVVLEKLKSESKKHNVENVLIMIDDEGSLASTNDEERKIAVENHYKWVDGAQYLGCHSIRVNAHGVGSYDDVAEAAVKGLSKLSEYAKNKNINILVENHGGYTSNGEWLANVMKKVGKSNCGTLPDFGNFCQTKDYGSINDENCKEVYDLYKGVNELMPYAKAVSAKSYDFDTNGNQPKIDYLKMLQIVKDAGYTGYIGVEYEGNNLSEKEGIIATKNLLISAAKQLN